MVLKRPFQSDDDGFGVVSPGTKRRFIFKNAVMDVLRGNSMDEMITRMEPFLRRVVRDEVEHAILPFLHPTARTSLNQVEPSERRGLQLLFISKLPSPIFTGSKVEAEDGGPVKIVLMDTSTGAVVKYGPLSSMKIEILVLDGDFCSDDHEDWSEKEFRTKVVRERDGKRPLVTGELNVHLREGVGIINDIVFTDNSSWIRCRKFRLGARAVQRSCGDMRIKEGRSEAFIVKDHRGELYKKHHPPSLNDEVWRLEKIAKDGKFHERLAAVQVKNVRDFLRWYTIDPNSLRKMLDAPNRTWETIVQHANTCVVDDEKFFAYSGNTDGVVLFFNAVFEPVAATFDGKFHQSLDKLNFSQMVLVEHVKKHAYKHVENFVPIDAHAIFGPQRSLTNQQVEPLNSPTSILQHPEFPVAHQEMQLDVGHAWTSTSNTYEAADCNQFQLSQNIPPINVFNPMLRNSFTLAETFPTHYNEEKVWSPDGLQGQIVSTSNFAAEATSEAPMATWSPINPACGSNSSFFFSPSNESELGITSSFQNFGVHISRTRNPRTAWCKIRAAVMWGSVRRDLATRKMARPFYVNQLLRSTM